MCPSEVIILNIKISFACPSCVVKAYELFLAHVFVIRKNGTINVSLAEKVFDAVLPLDLLALHNEPESCFQNKVSKFE